MHWIITWEYSSLWVKGLKATDLERFWNDGIVAPHLVCDSFLDYCLKIPCHLWEHPIQTDSSLAKDTILVGYWESQTWVLVLPLNFSLANLVTLYIKNADDM